MVAPVLLLAGVVAAQSADDETTEVALSADVLSTIESDQGATYQLTGNVVLIQDSTILRSETAIQYSALDLVVFEGSVEVVDGGDTLRADRIDYESDVKVAAATGNVSWTDGAIELAAPFGLYRVDDKIAAFSGGVTMRDSATVIRSVAGEYYSELEAAAFAGAVWLSDPEVQMFADSLHHVREGGVTNAVGNVRIYRENVLLAADSAESRQADQTNRLWGGPRLVQLPETPGGDTLVVSASRLDAASTDSSESFSASGGTSMWRSDIAGRADSLAYAESDSSASTGILMFGQPVLWSEQAQVTGDTLRIGLLDSKPDSLVAGPSAFVALRDSATGRIQQIKGTGLVARFAEEQLASMVVSPQAEALYFSTNEAEPSNGEAEESAVKFTSSSITVRFTGGEVDRLVASTDVQGEIIRFDEPGLPELSGLSWRADERPKRDELLTTELLEAVVSWPDTTTFGTPLP